MNKIIKVEIPDISNFDKLWEEYDTRTMNVFDEYYVHYTDKERKNKKPASIFESNIKSKYGKSVNENIEEYRNEMRQWKLYKVYSTIPAPRYGDDMGETYDINLKNITHSYIGCKKEGDEIYAEIKILQTYRGNKLKDIDETKLSLVPIYCKDRIFSLTIKKNEE